MKDRCHRAYRKTQVALAHMLRTVFYGGVATTAVKHDYWTPANCFNLLLYILYNSVCIWSTYLYENEY